MPKHSCLIRVEVESRDVVQPRLKRQEVLFNVRALTNFVEFVQRNRLFQGERTGLGTAQHGDMTERTNSPGDVTRERADISSFGDRGREGYFIQ